MAEDQKGRVLRSAAELVPGEEFSLRLSDGKIEAKVLKSVEEQEVKQRG